MSDRQGQKEDGEKRSFDWTFVKGFAAGILISNINKVFVLGGLVGTLSGIYIEQNYGQMPHVKTELQKALSVVRDAAGKGGKGHKSNEE